MSDKREIHFEGVWSWLLMLGLVSLGFYLGYKWGYSPVCKL